MLVKNDGPSLTFLLNIYSSPLGGALLKGMFLTSKSCILLWPHPGYQAPPEYLLQAAGPPEAQARPTSTVAARASTASTRASLFSMPVAMTEVRKACYCPEYHNPHCDILRSQSCECVKEMDTHLTFCIPAT